MFKQVVLVIVAIAVAAGVPSTYQMNVAQFGSRIINGNEAELGQFPYQAIVHSFNDAATVNSFCGGSLIKPLWVLTAAHCIWGTDYSTVNMGMVRIDAPTYSQVSRDRTMHSNYNNDTLYNDIAVVRLPVAASGANIGIIELPPANVGDLVGETLRASGFGKTVDDGPSSDILLYVNLRAITNAKCHSTYPSNVINTSLCATYINTLGDSTCKGDSGGPLTWNNLLVGVSSFVSHLGCASGSPSAYARVSSFLDWIDANTV